MCRKKSEGGKKEVHSRVQRSNKEDTEDCDTADGWRDLQNSDVKLLPLCVHWYCDDAAGYVHGGKIDILRNSISRFLTANCCQETSNIINCFNNEYIGISLLGSGNSLGSEVGRKCWVRQSGLLVPYNCDGHCTLPLVKLLLAVMCSLTVM